jgi:hypothetical protein
MSDDETTPTEDLEARILQVAEVKGLDPEYLRSLPMDELFAELDDISDEADLHHRGQATAEVRARNRAEIDEFLNTTERPKAVPAWLDEVLHRDPEEPAVTVRQAARALGLTRTHVYARIRAGSIRAIDGPGANGQGTVRLVPIAEIERLVMEQGPRSHGEVKPEPPETRPILQLERVTQRLESTRAVLSDAVEAMAEPEAGGWWGRRQRERERMARLEAALRAAHAAADAGMEGPSE